MKYILLNIAIIIMKIIYFFFKLFPIKNKITMISRQSNFKTLDFKLIEEEIKKENKYQTVILCKKLEGKDKVSISNLIKYGFHMLTQMYHIATSKFVILDSYCICISVLKHKRKLKVIQIWHSVGTMKKFGYQILDLDEGSNSKLAKTLKMHKNYDIVLCGGKGYVNDLTEGFNCEKSIIKIIPLPRTDLLKDKKYIAKTKEKIYKTYPKLNEKINILYVPTFRKDETELEKNINKMMKTIDHKKYNFIVKLHPLSKIIINDKRIYTPSNFSSMEMLTVASHVITDYSCILYEAGLLGKALYFYCFDYEEYNQKRSLNIDYFKELPGIISKDFVNIYNSIENKKYDYKKLEKFIKNYIDSDGFSTKKIYKLILELDRSNKEKNQGCEL